MLIQLDALVKGDEKARKRDIPEYFLGKVFTIIKIIKYNHIDFPGSHD